MGATNSARRLSKPVTAKNKTKNGAAGDKGELLIFMGIFYVKYLLFIYCLLIFSSYPYPLFWGGYLIVTLKDDKIIVANADISILNLLTGIIKRHVQVSREGWLREVSLQSWSCLWVKNAFKMTYYYKMNEAGRHTMIQVRCWFNFSLYLSFLQFIS